MLSTAKIRRGSWTYYANQVQHGACEYFLGLGEAPGRWRGRGLEPLGLESNALVSERELEALFGRALHPKANVQLGRTWRADAVTGYDLCFSAPKSVSTLWALGSDRTSGAVRAAHKAAVTAAMDYLDTHAAFSRTGLDGTRQVATDGFGAAVFDHRTSRAGDPQLHTHALVLNKVRCRDGEWRTIDGHDIYAHKKSAGTIYQAALRNELSRRLGLTWTPVSKDGQAEIAGVPTDIMRLWSKRSAQVTAEADPVIAAYEAELGRPLSPSERIAVMKVAVIKTRPDKDTVDIVTLTHRWAGEAADLGHDRDTLEAAVTAAPRAARSELTEPVVAQLLREAVEAAGSRRAVFTRSDLAAEVAARIPAIGFSGEMVREVVEHWTDRALRGDEAVTLQPEHDGPVRASDARYASRTNLDKEREIVGAATAGRATSTAIVDPFTVITTCRMHGLDTEQFNAVGEILTSGDAISVLVAPAGTGKTTSIGAAVHAWRKEWHHVIALAPSARAAKELAAAAGTPADTVAKFLYEQHRQRHDRPSPENLRYQLGEDNVIVVDEASMLSTADLHALVRRAWTYRAKLVLVGDPAQIGAIDRAGGMLPVLADHMDAPILGTVHRFAHDWERDASLALRRGDPASITAYLSHDRIHAVPGDTDAVDAVFAHYTRLAETGRQMLMLARTNVDVDDLNIRARTWAIETGRVRGGSLLAAGDRDWRVGDRLRATRNNRGITLGGDYLRNGDLLVITGSAPGGLTVRRIGCSTDTAVLPADYLSDHTRGGWATTIDAAQGATVDDAVLLARPGLDRSHFYVGLTRGRVSNHVYLAPPPQPEIGPRTAPAADATNPTDELQRMLSRIDDRAAAITRLPDAVTDSPDWHRRPTRAEVAARWQRAVARAGRRASSRAVLPPRPRLRTRTRHRAVGSQYADVQ